MIEAQNAAKAAAALLALASGIRALRSRKNESGGTLRKTIVFIAACAAFALLEWGENLTVLRMAGAAAIAASAAAYEIITLVKNRRRKKKAGAQDGENPV